MSKLMVISGGSSGIGAAVVQRFLNAAYRVINCDLQVPSVEHPQLHTICCDVTSVAAIQTASLQIAALTDHVDVLVCSAGVHHSANVLQSSESDFERVMAVNVKSCFFLTQAIIPMMHNGGSIVYLGSDQSLIAKKNSAIYCVSKAALTGLTKSTAVDFASAGIRANLVAAGTVDTPLTRRALEGHCARTNADLTQAFEGEAAEFPVGRIAQPAEIAELIYFLGGDQAAFITGAVIPIDGGYTAA